MTKVYLNDQGCAKLVLSKIPTLNTLPDDGIKINRLPQTLLLVTLS